MEGMLKRGRGKRGIASFSKKIPADKYHIDFDENHIAIGDMSKDFMSWYGMMVQYRLPYHIDTGKLDDTYFKELWLETKRTWNIKTDAPEKYMKKKAMKIGTNFRSRLVTDFVNKGLNACDKFPFLEPNHWNDFVVRKTSAKFLAKSEKAKASNAKNKFKPRLGRGGWKGVEKKKDIIWPQLELKYEFLKRIQNDRSKMYLLGCAVQNKETKLYELPPEAIEDFNFLDREEQKMIADESYGLNKEDPLVRLLGPEHGGRSRMVSDIIGSTRVHGGLYKNVNHSRGSGPQVDTVVDHYNGDGVADMGNEKLQLIRSPNVSPAQGGQDSPSKQKENAGLTDESLEVHVEEFPHTISISDDDQPSVTIENQIENVTNSQNLSFEKRSTLWVTLESMELFKMIPQNPHFRPLDNEKECTREGQALIKILTYIRVVEVTSQLKLEHPRSVFEDNFEKLVELESHGFDVKAVRDRLTGLLLIKEIHEGLKEESGNVKDKMEVERFEGQRIDNEIDLVDKHVAALLEKRGHVFKMKEKKDEEIGALEAQVDDINEGMSEVRCKFAQMAAASLCVSKQQTPST